MYKREVITIKRQKGYWYKKFDDYDKSFKRISKKEAIQSIKRARKRGDLFLDDDENKAKHHLIVFAYFN